MSVLASALLGGGIGLATSLAYWRRRRETDASGNLCLRYFGPRYAIPLVGIAFLVEGIRHLDDPCYVENPENFFVIFGFVLFSLLASVHIVLYRITLKHGTIEQNRWPLRPLVYSLDNLSFIEEKGRQAVLHFGKQRKLKIQLLLSGQRDFLDQLQAILAARIRPHFARPNSAKQKANRDRHP